MGGNSGSGGCGSGVDARDWSRSSVLLESNEPSSDNADATLGGLTWGFALLNENGLGKSNGSPKREVVFAFGNSSVGGTTGMMGDEGGYAGWVSSVSGGWGIVASLILPCSDENGGGVNTLPCSDETSGLARILPCSNETWDSNGGRPDRGG